MVLTAHGSATAAPSFADPGPLVSNAGNFTIKWEADAPVTLEIARDASFSAPRELYHGTNHALFLSGLEDGDYYLRLTDEAGALSEPLALSVEHQPLLGAVWLAAMGAVVFLAILVVIVRGARNE